MKSVYFQGLAYKQFIEWEESSQDVFQKIKVLINEIGRDPFRGLGKPEPLKHQYKGYWSRRINGEHRIIYKYEDGVIFIASLKGHYV